MDIVVGGITGGNTNAVLEYYSDSFTCVYITTGFGLAGKFHSPDGSSFTEMLLIFL